MSKNEYELDYILGIDVGYTGAVALFDVHQVEYTIVEPMPILKKKIGKKVEKSIDIERLNRLIKDCCNTAIVIEDIKPFNMGRKSAFSWGKQLAIIETLAVINNLDIYKVEPLKWQAHYGIASDKSLTKYQRRKQLKAQSIEVAKMYYDKVKTDGEADAVNIAQYYYEYLLTVGLQDLLFDDDVI